MDSLRRASKTNIEILRAKKKPKDGYPSLGSRMSFRIIEPGVPEPITGNQLTDSKPRRTEASHIYDYDEFNEVWKIICDAADERCCDRSDVGYFYIFPAAGTWHVRYSTEILEMGRHGHHLGREKDIPALGEEEWKVEQFMGKKMNQTT